MWLESGHARMKLGSDDLNDRISRTRSRATQRRREANSIALSDVRRYRREGLVSEAMLLLTHLAEGSARTRGRRASC